MTNWGGYGPVYCLERSGILKHKVLRNICYWVSDVLSPPASNHIIRQLKIIPTCAQNHKTQVSHHLGQRFSCFISLIVYISFSMVAWLGTKNTWGVLRRALTLVWWILDRPHPSRPLSVNIWQPEKWGIRSLFFSVQSILMTRHGQLFTHCSHEKHLGIPKQCVIFDP